MLKRFRSKFIWFVLIAHACICAHLYTCVCVCVLVCVCVEAGYPQSSKNVNSFVIPLAFNTLIPACFLLVAAILKPYFALVKQCSCISFNIFLVLQWWWCFTLGNRKKVSLWYYRFCICRSKISRVGIDLSGQYQFKLFNCAHVIG